MIAQKMLSQEEVAQIERGLYERLTAPSTSEARTDLVDFAARNLRQLIEAYKMLQARVQS